ncbi:MAG: 50S ribosomal protein L11 methyltransferase [Candidatus Zixiibacteriota bacterium]
MQSSILSETAGEYIELEVAVPEGIADQVSSLLMDLGSQGVWSKPDGEESILIGYLSNQSDGRAVADLILHYLDELRILGFDVGDSRVGWRKIREKEWTKEFERSFEPIFVTDDVVILPSWGESDFPGKTVIRIKLGMAFGTGAHATTQLCLRALKRYVKPGYRVLDVGCGSGILSILSAKLGASFAWGLDIDQDAIENANQNLALNHVENLVEVRQGTVSARVPSQFFDIVVANLNKREIFESFDHIKMQLRNQGLLIFSGMLKEEEKEIRDFFERKNLRLVEASHQDDWLCFVCTARL